jgi:hypothetical protein
VSRLLSIDDREPRPDAAILNPEIAQFHLWLAQAQRDHNRISDREMMKMEGAAGMLASRSRVMWNPITGEIRTFGEIESRFDPENFLHRIAYERATGKTTG